MEKWRRCYFVFLDMSKNDLIMEAIDSAVTKGREGKGCVLVKSAGNTSGSITFPGNYKPSVLAVANMTVDGSLRYSSCYGSNMFITAPGTNIYPLFVIMQ